MNSRFEKYLKVIEQPNVDKTEQENTLNELHKSFAMLSQEEQKFANIFLHDVQRGDIVMEKGKSFRDYVTAVSYTHLDVYKRQMFNRILDILLPTMISFLLG